MKYYGITDIGLVRQSNQDSYCILTNEAQDVLAVVCDGIGGGKAGDIASRHAVSRFGELFLNQKEFREEKQATQWLYQAVGEVNGFIHHLAESESAYQGMGTTLVAALVTKVGTFVVNVGDSRAYLKRANHFDAITTDHNLAEQMVENGYLKKEDAFYSLQKNVLTNAIGIEGRIRIDIYPIHASYDCLILCTDGLHGYVRDEEIAEILNQEEWDNERRIRRLVEASLQKGGYDNVTIVLLDMKNDA